MRTKSFNEVIADYLKQRAAEDTLFAPKFTNPKKSIDECCRYILGDARKRGNEVVMTDNEVFGLAIHYYEEENIKVNARIGNSVKSRVVSSKQVPEVQTVEQLSIQYERPVFSTVKRGRGKREESKLQLSLFD